jgi:hypothetical protein
MALYEISGGKSATQVGRESVTLFPKSLF